LPSLIPGSMLVNRGDKKMTPLLRIPDNKV
jgi:hypothetical protein